MKHRPSTHLLLFIASAAVIVAALTAITAPARRQNAECEAAGGIAVQSNRGWTCIHPCDHPERSTP